MERSIGRKGLQADTRLFLREGVSARTPQRLTFSPDPETDIHSAAVYRRAMTICYNATASSRVRKARLRALVLEDLKSALEASLNRSTKKVRYLVEKRTVHVLEIQFRRVDNILHQALLRYTGLNENPLLL